MPYFWETRTWHQRLQELEIKQPPESGFYMYIPDADGFADGSLKGVLFKDYDNYKDYFFPYIFHRTKEIEKLLHLFDKAKNLEMFRKFSELDRIMMVIDRMIDWIKDGGQPPKSWGDIRLSDLQALWYVMRANLWNTQFDKVLCNDNTLNDFMTEYWSVWFQCIGPKLPQNSNKSILEKLLCFPGIGMANPRSFFHAESDPVGFEQLQSGIQKFFTLVSENMGDLCFQFNRLGSMGDGSRVGYCDEFDYRLEFPQFDFSSLLGDDTSIEHVTAIANQFEPRISTILPTFMNAVSSLKGFYVNENLEVLGSNDNGTVPYVVFKWVPDLACPKTWMLAKVDCTLSIPCHGIWPGSQKVDPLGKPIPKDCTTHLMIPNPRSSRLTKWKWSVCQVQKDFVKSLPKYMRLGFIISKVICSHAFMTEDILIHSIPSSFCLKNNLFNALSCGELSLHADSMSEDQLVIDALQVADVIIAGLEKGQLAYFYEGEPVEHVWHYFPEYLRQKFQNFLPRYILQKLVGTHIKHKNVNIADCDVNQQLEKIMPYSLSLNLNTKITSDLSLMREILGLLISKLEHDDWGKLARDAVKWADYHIVFGAKHMFEDAALVQLRLQDRCMEDLECVRSQVARWSVTKVQRYMLPPTEKITSKSEFCTRRVTDHSEFYDNECYDEEANLLSWPLAKAIRKPHQSIGDAYDQFYEALENMLHVIREGLTKDIENQPDREEKLTTVRRAFDVEKDYNFKSNEKFRLVLSLGHVVNLNKGSLPQWKDQMKIELKGVTKETIDKKENEQFWKQHGEKIVRQLNNQRTSDHST